MKTELTPEQIAITMLTNTLRERKEKIKRSIAFLNNAIVDIDMQLRDLRIAYSTITPVEVKPVKTNKHKETDEEKLARLENEAMTLRDKLNKRLANHE